MKKIVFFVIVLASIFIINNFIHSIYSLWQKNDLVVKARQNLEKEEKENKKLKDDLAKANKPQFVEEEARDKLFLTKSGEGVVILPSLKASQSANTQKDNRQNWEKWWDMFF